jgi:FixJ family two-component response regulator
MMWLSSESRYHFILEEADVMEFDCVVADIYLPQMNGLQLQEELNRTDWVVREGRLLQGDEVGSTL